MSSVEIHPWPPFLPTGTILLFLGSFPPPEKRWSMNFFYPNPQNDFWRVFGLIFYNDKDHFVRRVNGKVFFDQKEIEQFLTDQKIGIFDAAVKIIRTEKNASDDKLEIVEPVDLNQLLQKIPSCRTIAATGKKSLETILSITGCLRKKIPAIGEKIETEYADRDLQIWRMPSTSRAWPAPLDLKAEFYRKLFC